MLEFTGERFIPGAGSSDLHHLHLHRYRLAALLAGGRRVLDVGSGEGYGAALLAQSGASVTGLDVDAEAVAHARATYGGEGLDFVVGSAEDPPLETGSFDLITCFETIEHVSSPLRLIEAIEALLAPDGLLVASTPDRDAYNASLAVPNPYHVAELSRSELEALLAQRFSFELYGQQATVASHVWHATAPPDVDQIDVVAGNDLERPIIWIVVAARPGVPLPRLPSAVFVDCGHRGDAERQDLLQQIRGARVQLAEYERHIQQLAEALQVADERARRAAAGS